MSGSDARDLLLRRLSEIHDELAVLEHDEFAAKHRLLSESDEVRGALARSMPERTPRDRKQIAAEIEALTKARAHHITVMREERWGQELPIWLYWLRPFRHLSLENRPSYPVRRRRGDEPTKPFARFWGLPVVTHFQPEIREINQRIAFLESQLGGGSSRTRRIRLPRRHRHLDDGNHPG